MKEQAVNAFQALMDAVERGDRQARELLNILFTPNGKFNWHQEQLLKKYTQPE